MTPGEDAGGCERDLLVYHPLACGSNLEGEL